MTPKDFSIQVVRQLIEAGHVAYWAGGCVRDLLRGKSPNDFDVATNATPSQVRSVFGARKTLAVGESFGVIIVLGPKSAGQIEVATFRSEGEYSDGRRPDQVEYCSPEQDALRRDFTINGMFLDPLTDVIHDYVNGKKDLERRIVRAIGDPLARMTEDKLRMLRAVRFASTLDFELDHMTADAVRQLAREVQVVSAERIAQEFRKMFSDVHRSRAVELAKQLSLLDILIPEVKQFSGTSSAISFEQILTVLKQLDVASFTTAMAALLRNATCPPLRHLKEVPDNGTVQAVCRRLKLSNDETETIVWLSSHRGVFHEVMDESIAKLKRLVIDPHFEELQHLERTYAAVTDQSLQPFDQVEDFLKRTPQEQINPPEILTGRDLIEAGYQPGPQFKEWLEDVRTLQLEGQLTNKSEALAHVRKSIL